MVRYLALLTGDPAVHVLLLVGATVATTLTVWLRERGRTQRLRAAIDKAEPEQRAEIILAVSRLEGRQFHEDPPRRRRRPPRRLGGDDGASHD